MKKFFYYLFAAVLCCGFVACDTEDGDTDSFENQNIPQDLCGTWYAVEYGSNYYQYLTINTDGTMEGLYCSNGSITEQRGRCYYKDNEMVFYYNGSNGWSQLYGAEKEIVEWSSSCLTLGSFYASFLTKTKETPSFIGKDRDTDLVGTWIYHQTTTAVATMMLNRDGTGNRKFDSPVDYSSDDIINWFTRNGWLYLMYEGKKDYTLYKYNKSGNVLYLTYCSVIDSESTYEYHKDEKNTNSRFSESDLIGHWTNVVYNNSETTSEGISFLNNTSIVYEASIYNGDDEQEVIAKGTYTLNGDVISISYNDVSVYTSDDSNKFWGFTNKKSRKVSYTIRSISGTRMKVTDDSGKQIEFEMYKSI